ncbi:MAG: M1 family metallopeptidase [Bacteroidota bacterium]|nr:M1 family metallopeptidase [Bacteroidota bacterium]MDP4253990.1 M1 family metallopeptidase [Bacteroidota bacterium]MDP4259202.1 M1 family metallopeptidase [Bacteroidota bacterium]
MEPFIKFSGQAILIYFTFLPKVIHMLRSTLIAVLGLICFFRSDAQSLYMPRAVRQAYEKGTRSPDGRPGKNYWQNTGRYVINVTAMPPDRTIKGSEQIVYINNSPDTLRNPVIKLFLNIHKPGAPRAFPAGEDYLTDGTHIDAFSVDGRSQPWEENGFFYTWHPIRLPKPLLPHDSVHLSFDWHYQISLRSNREGMIDSTTYFLAYFYPRVAVFDDYNGWDRMTFTDLQEFYSDFNEYTVTVNVPANYIVWGTGTLQHPEKLLQPAVADRFARSFHSDQTIRIATPEDLRTKKVTAQNAVNSWQFKATDIPDMAFGLSDHFVWDAASVLVDDAAGRRASVQAAYNDTAADYHSMVQFGRHALDWLSHNWPGIPYPYEKTTIFHGYAGMEYPMMANDETYPDTIFARFVAEHEIAHTYMPFYMGINETRYGFMDEGWATTFELLIGRADLGDERAEQFYRQFRVNRWINDPSPDEDLPITTPGDVFNGNGLGNNEYGKPSLGYLAVKDLLGDALFSKCLHEYMSRWHGKHPIPWDFFNSFNDASGSDLNWFWNNWFFSNNYIDLAAAGLSRSGNGYTLRIRNIGGMAAPFDIVITREDGSVETMHETPAVWKADQKLAMVNLPGKKKIRSLKLDGGIFMDANPADNQWPAQ